jgi:RimJ/RimL family protein N-acetyltransferase
MVSNDKGGFQVSNMVVCSACPEFDTTHFHLRLVQEADAEDLLKCYSDRAAQIFFNSDNCTSNFCYASLEEMQNCIRFWIDSYGRHDFVRWSIVEKRSWKAVGTVEMFCDSTWAMTHYAPGGCLRIDIASEFEATDYLSEQLNLANENFFELFGAKTMVIKAIPKAEERRKALVAAGFAPYGLNHPTFKHFYGKIEKEQSI